MKPIVITLGEPAGIGPDLFLKIIGREFPAPLVVLTDPELLIERGKILGLNFAIPEFNPKSPASFSYLSLPLPMMVAPGKPNAKNAEWILKTIAQATKLCIEGQCHALVTGPLNKAVINEAGISFSGHTEYLRELTHSKKTVMMLTAGKLRVALVTTHIPVASIPAAITENALIQSLNILNMSLQQQFNCPHPKIAVCGLNPHAGEGGYLGTEEIEVITPVINQLNAQGFNLTGPMAADSAFIPSTWQQYDAILAMYHDQGLTAIKTLAFHNAVNVTLGLPIIRTSVDHGTAFHLAGTDEASEKSLMAAIHLACELRNPQ